MVNKLWGFEDWIINTDQYCGKILHLKKGYQCSFHFHKIKDETFYIMSGKVLLKTGIKHLDATKDTIMSKNDRIRIEPDTVHSFCGLQDSIIIEFSTHHDENDSYRLPDKLSRKIPQSEFSIMTKFIR